MIPKTDKRLPTSNEDEINIIGPKKGFSPQVGTMVSMMNWMRIAILNPVRGLTVEDLDYIHDSNSNSIGAMLLHLAATERFYQIHTFEGRDWGDWSEKDNEEWSTAMGLGDDGRTKIKGNNLEYYLDKLEKVREHTLAEFAKRDDNWLMEIDQDWFDLRIGGGLKARFFNEQWPVSEEEIFNDGTVELGAAIIAHYDFKINKNWRVGSRGEIELLGKDLRVFSAGVHLGYQF